MYVILQKKCNKWIFKSIIINKNKKYSGYKRYRVKK